MTALYCAYWLNPAIVAESWNFRTASLATLGFAARLAQVKRIQPLAA
jgi:hypothetical protein